MDFSEPSRAPRRDPVSTTPAAVLAIGALCACLAGAARADEGMWTYDNFPSAQVKAKYGVTIDQAWLDHVRGGTARLSSGCSSSIVSGQGLVLTNHHCVSDCAQDLSSPERDYIKAGYSVTGRRDERQCPGMQADVLMSIADVTPTVGAATAGKSGQDFVKARDGAIASIEQAACAGKAAVQTCEVVSLYQGGQYKLYIYRKYTDVRLVFAPELSTAFFGGDPDNFNFPRYDLDVSFLRLYENGAPATTPGHLRWSPAPPRDGEPVFVAGNPGSTSRLLTVEQLESLRDFVIPQTLLLLSEFRGRLIEFGDQGPEQARIADRELFGIENAFKAYHGQFQALSEPGFLQKKSGADAELRAKVAADPGLAAKTGDPWGEIARAQVDRAALNSAYGLLERRPGFGSQLFAYARDLVRAAQERAKPNGERLPDYTDSRLPLLEKEVLDVKPVYPSLEKLELAFWLTKVREYLTADAPETKAFLGADSPEDLAARLSASGLGDPKARKALWDGGMAAIQASRDPLIVYVLATDPTARTVRKAWEEKVSGPTDRAAERIAAARFAVYGTSVYPDATFTPRVSFGKVEGWTDRGRTIPPFTRFAGLWTRATGKPPFQLAPKWLAARGKLDDATIFDFVSDNDIVGGNSGSPIVNAKAEVIGAVFDGDILSLGGAFAFDDGVNRAVSVSTASATQALRKVYGQEALVAELMAP
ncbi:MAG: S46 family peptidase [Caulobacteraceae bacterium]